LDIDLGMIEDVTKVVEICNEYRKMFCFTVTLRTQEIINVFRNYTRENRRQKLEEIKKEREKLLKIYKYYREEYKNK